jgi:hypothetical protein
MRIIAMNEPRPSAQPLEKNEATAIIKRLFSVATILSRAEVKVLDEGQRVQKPKKEKPS